MASSSVIYGQVYWQNKTKPTTQAIFWGTRPTEHPPKRSPDDICLMKRCKVPKGGHGPMSVLGKLVEASQHREKPKLRCERKQHLCSHYLALAFLVSSALGPCSSSANKGVTVAHFTYELNWIENELRQKGCLAMILASGTPYLLLVIIRLLLRRKKMKLAHKIFFHELYVLISLQLR